MSAARATERALKTPLRKIRNMLRNQLLRRRLRRGEIRIVIGSSGVFEGGWIPTDMEQLNLAKPETWEKYLTPASVDAMLAEHVWEHLTPEQASMGARICHRYLKPGGYIRIAVPDGLHPDPEYRKYIAPGGAAGGEPGGHKVVYTYRELADVFESAGFKAKLLEFHDEAGRLHIEEWDPAEGMIHRSNRFDARGPVSIVLDAIKPR